MNIFVAKLSPKTTDESLKSLFNQFGTVNSAKVIFDRQTRRSKLYGFVEMPDEDEGNEAISKLNDSTFEESVIVVKVAIPKEKDTERRQDNGRRNFSRR